MADLPIIRYKQEIQTVRRNLVFKTTHGPKKTSAVHPLATRKLTSLFRSDAGSLSPFYTTLQINLPTTVS